jgi:nucleoside 2-deoxyribosyltransferase
MKIYIASPYIKQQTVNKQLYESLKNTGFDVFLPKTININAKTDVEQLYVAETCYDEIDDSDIIILVYKFGISVACEAGYAIAQKRAGRDIRIVLLNLADDGIIRGEAMLMPYVDFEERSAEKLIKHIKNHYAPAVVAG